MEPAEPANENVPPRRNRNRSRGWCFTLNNYSESEKNAVIDCCENADRSAYVVQEERGENGTPHLQGFVHFANQVSFSTIRQWNPRIHWERTHSVAASVAYCSNPDKRVGRIWCRGFTISERDLRIIREDSFYPWQRELREELLGEPHMRNITWYCDAVGGCGKTAFARFLMKNVVHTLFVSSGRATDIAYQIIKTAWDPKIVVFNLPRSAEQAMSYASLESVKDGIIYSGKYEGGSKLFPPPHVLVFANFFPDLTKLSLDRWDIRELLPDPPRVRPRGE